MKSYLQGLITGGMLVLSSIIFMGQTKDSVISVMKTQTEIMKKLVEHENMLLKMNQNNEALRFKIKKELLEFEKEQHEKNLYLASYIQYLDKIVTIK